MPRDIRDLANRAELDFQRRPHRFRRRAWWSGVILALGCWGWLLSALITGDHRVYEGGPLSTAHAFIANDCRQCHTTWQTARRLVTGDVKVSSISNTACIKCHAATEHHPGQIPAHDQLSCAECHREHQGKLELASVTDSHCVRCHANLETTAGPSKLFARQIKGFSAADGHPEFNLTQRLKSDTVPSNLFPLDEFEALLKQDPAVTDHQRQMTDVLSPRVADAVPRGGSKWRDRGEIKFNHAKHLDPKRVNDKYGKHVDLSRNCQACHVPDEAGRYMRPIQYEQHCAQCHPLWFDNQNHPGVEVPHERPEVVRGFLTQKYTLMVWKTRTAIKETLPARPLPGRADRPPLAVDQVGRLEDLVAQGERLAQDHGRIAKSGGGCRYCHTVDSSDDGDWSVRSPRIPERWMPHSRFDHAAHRMLDCGACHAGVAKHDDTADVMLPAIAECRACHVSPDASAPILGQSPLNFSNAFGSRPIPAHAVKSSCVMCHIYHRPQPGQTQTK